MYLKYTGVKIPKKYLDDCIRISQALKEEGFYITAHDAFVMWDNYSDTLCAGWIILPDTNEEICSILIGEDSYDD